MGCTKLASVPHVFSLGWMPPGGCWWAVGGTGELLGPAHWRRMETGIFFFNSISFEQRHGCFIGQSRDHLGFDSLAQTVVSESQGPDEEQWRLITHKDRVHLFQTFPREREGITMGVGELLGPPTHLVASLRHRICSRVHPIHTKLPVIITQGRTLGVKFLLHNLVAVWSWTTYLTSLNPNCQLCKIEAICIHLTLLWDAYRRVRMWKSSINYKPLQKWDKILLSGILPTVWPLALTPLAVVLVRSLLVILLLQSGMRCPPNSTTAFLNLVKLPYSFYLKIETQLDIVSDFRSWRCVHKQRLYMGSGWPPGWEMKDVC